MNDVGFEDIDNYRPLSFESPDGKWKMILYLTRNKKGQIVVDDSVWEAQDMPSNFDDIESD